MILRSRGMDGFFRYFCSERFTDDMRVEFEINVRKKPHELAVWLNATAPRDAKCGGLPSRGLAGKATHAFSSTLGASGCRRQIAAVRIAAVVHHLPGS